MYGLWQAVIRLPVGIVTDRIGRRKTFILLGIVLAGVGALVLGLAEGFAGLTLGRSLVGLSMGAWVLQVVFFGSLFSDEEMIKAGSILTLASSLAKLAGTFSTGYLNNFGGYITAFIVSAAAAAVSLLVLLPVPGQARKLVSAEPFRIALVFKDKKLRIVSLLAAVNQFLNFGIIFGFFPLMAQQMGATDLVKSYLLSVNILFLIGGNILVTSIGKSENSLRLLGISYFLFGAGITLTPFAGGIPFLFVFQAMLGLASYVGTVLTGLLLLMGVYMLILKVLIGDSPLLFLKSTRDVLLLAFSTSSSAAVMPLSIRTAEDKLKVRPSISQFVIPLGATINMNGTALYQAVATIFLAQVYGIDLSMGSMALVVAMAVVMVVVVGVQLLL
jgi:MFS family permease